MARAEKETLVDRIKSGLAEARRKGVKLGRPEGTSLDTAELLAKHKEFVRLVKDGLERAQCRQDRREGQFNGATGEGCNGGVKPS
jgi:DNA invertase Pin-like site-specific DNA recombinase